MQGARLCSARLTIRINTGHAGQDANISAAAARYIMLSSPALVLLCFSDTIRSHLTAQMDILPCTGAASAT